MENLVESFITELECHRRNISKEIEDVANTRINELNAILKRLEEVRSRTLPQSGRLFAQIPDRLFRSKMRKIQKLFMNYPKWKKITLPKLDHLFRQFVDRQQLYQIHITLLPVLKRISISTGEIQSTFNIINIRSGFRT